MYKQARVTLEQALQISEALGSRRLRAYDLLNLADTHRLSRDSRTARRLAEQALGEMTASGDQWGRAEALLGWGLGLEDSGDAVAAGLARCALEQGQLDEARQHVTEVWNYLQEHGWRGMDTPGQVYQTCADIFDALGDSATSRAAIEVGYREIMRAAGKINPPEWRKSFLENNRFNRAMVEMWERMQH
jgi:tetratricopeptide (TPR) repeat protein